MLHDPMKYANEIAKILALAEQDGFQKGWQAARDALSAPVPMAKVAGGAIPAPAKKKAKKAKKKEGAPGAPVKTVETQVRDSIEANPGKTGAEITRLLADLNPRTVRTMLRRLKLRGEIEKSGEGWFTKIE